MCNRQKVGITPLHCPKNRPYAHVCMYSGYRRDANTMTGEAQITTDKTRIEISSAKNGRSGAETRPKNMAVQWIIRVF
jgi:hypothetical protein